MKNSEPPFSQLSEKDTASCASLYADVYSNPPWNEPWEQLSAIKRLTFLMQIPTSIGFKYIRNEQIIGFWLGYIEEGFDELAIKEVVVHPDFQQQGIGTKLMHHSEKVAKNSGLKSITLSTLRDSFMDKFYQGLGYQESSNIRFMRKEI